ncbi:MAG: hypothetical protein JNN02_02215 [Tabrizicola sp.]|nr:hypothetical protein [Tabrizicola sp.]
MFFAVLFGVSFWNRKGGGGAEWILPTIAYFLVHDLVRKLSQRQLIRARDAAPVRNRSSVAIKLGDEGISVDGAAFWWPEITKVFRVGGATFLEFYPFQALAIPDEFLPADTTQEALLQLIDQWRST